MFSYLKSECFWFGTRGLRQIALYVFIFRTNGTKKWSPLIFSSIHSKINMQGLIGMDGDSILEPPFVIIHMSFSE